MNTIRKMKKSVKKPEENLKSGGKAENKAFEHIFCKMKA